MQLKDSLKEIFANLLKSPIFERMPNYSKYSDINYYRVLKLIIKTTTNQSAKILPHYNIAF